MGEPAGETPVGAGTARRPETASVLSGARAIRWQLPLAVALGVLAVVAIGPSAAASPALYLAATTPELARVDLRERRLPDRMTLPGIAIGIAGVAIEGIVAGAVPWVPILAAAILVVLFLALAIAGGMGMGDVKLVAIIGLASPTLAIAVLAPFAAFLLGGVASVVVLVRRGRGARIPFGPFLLAGYVVALVASIGL
jgi:leader peptidase (prepilin peptidase)/N-methyltransferase